MGAGKPVRPAGGRGDWLKEDRQLDEEVVVDGNLITSRVPNDLPAFCRTIVAALEA
jgi:putative intracellular protease/amidase